MHSPARTTQCRSGLISCLIFIGALAGLVTMMHAEYKAEGTSDCKAKFGASARYDWQSNTCWTPPPPLPECRQRKHHDQSKGPPTFGALATHQSIHANH